MNKKTIMKILKAHGLEISSEIEKKIGESFKNTHIFTPEQYQEHVSNIKSEAKADYEKSATKKANIVKLLEKHKIKGDRQEAFIKLQGLTELEDTELEKAITDGIKDYPEWKSVAKPPSVEESKTENEDKPKPTEEVKHKKITSVEDLFN